mgnify:CR=1 FL=1
MLTWGWMKMLKVENLVVSYGGIEALKGISLEVPKGQIVTLIGANGAGKSTLLRSVVGLVKPKSGQIIYNGDNITGLNSQQIVKKGLTLVPEGRRIFPNLTVLENLQIGAYMRSDKEGIQKDIDWVYEMFPRLQERSWQMAGTLSGGEQQRVSIARALAKNPKLLLCDEPTGALDYQTGKAILKLLQDMCRERGMTVIVITHNSALTPMADRVIKIKNGKVSRMTMNDHPTPIEEIEW